MGYLEGGEKHFHFRTGELIIYTVGTAFSQSMICYWRREEWGVWESQVERMDYKL